MVKVFTRFIKPNAEGARFDKSVESIQSCITDSTMWEIFARGNSIHNFTNLVWISVTLDLYTSN